MPLVVTQSKYETRYKLKSVFLYFLCNWRQIDFYNDIGHVWLTVVRYRAENIYEISMKKIGGLNF